MRMNASAYSWVASSPGSTSGMNTRMRVASFSNPGNSFSKMFELSRHHGRARARIARSSISSRWASSTL